MSQVTNLAFFRARHGQSEALGAALASLVGPTRLETGCLNYDLHRSVDDAESGLFTRIGARLKVLTPTCGPSTCRHF